MKPDDYNSAIGSAVSLMARTAAYRLYPIECITEWIRPPVLLDQILFFRNTGNVVVGYITWALLAKDTEWRLINDPKVLFHFSEWNEGDSLWIMDFVVVNGEVARYVSQAKAHFSESFSIGKSVRRNAEGIVRKVTMWPLR